MTALTEIMKIHIIR